LNELFFVYVKFFVQLIHKHDIDEDQDAKDIDGALLGKPKSKWKSTKFYTVERFSEDDPTAVGYDKPYAE